MTSIQKVPDFDKSRAVGQKDDGRSRGAPASCSIVVARGGVGGLEEGGGGGLSLPPDLEAPVADRQEDVLKKGRPLQRHDWAGMGQDAGPGVL